MLVVSAKCTATSKRTPSSRGGFFNEENLELVGSVVDNGGVGWV